MTAARLIAGAAFLLVLSACGQKASNDTANAPSPAPAPASTVYTIVDDFSDPSLVLPGDFAEATSVADLEAKFGKENIKTTEVSQTDGSMIRSLVLFPDDPTRRAYVTFHDAEKMTGLASILVNDAGSRWRGKGGVQVGMSFAELRKANGKPFYFSGFDDQRRGWVRDQWSPSLDDKDDTLGALDVGENEHMYFGVDLGAKADAPAGSYPKEDSTSSDDPKYPRLGEFVEVAGITAYTSLDDEWE